MEKVIRTGVGVMLINNNKILLGHRVNKAQDTGGIYDTNN